MARSSDHSGPAMDPLKVIGVIMLLVVLLWVITWRLHKNTMRRAVIDVVAVEQRVQSVFAFSGKAKRQLEANRTTLEKIKFQRFARLEPGDLIAILSITGVFWIPGSSVFLAGIAFVTWRRSLRHRYRRKLNFETLIAEQAINIACVRPMLKINPLKMSDSEGPWRYAEDYRTFSLRHKLLLDGRRKPIPKTDKEAEAFYFDFEKALKVFANQLGKPFTGYENLQPHEQGIFALHLAHMMVDRDASAALADRMSTSFQQATKTRAAIIDIDGADEIVAKHINNPIWVKLSARHYFVNTLLTAMRAEALKRAGVLQPAEFIWLRPTDRTLWYSLHQVNMRVAHQEAAGVRAHYLAELAEGAALQRPVVKQAVIALRQALSDEGSISERSDDFRYAKDDADPANPPIF